MGGGYFWEFACLLRTQTAGEIFCLLLTPPSLNRISSLAFQEETPTCLRLALTFLKEMLDSLTKYLNLWQVLKWVPRWTFFSEASCDRRIGLSGFLGLPKHENNNVVRFLRISKDFYRFEDAGFTKKHEISLQSLISIDFHCFFEISCFFVNPSSSNR